MGWRGEKSVLDCILEKDGLSSLHTKKPTLRDAYMALEADKWYICETWNQKEKFLNF